MWGLVVGIVMIWVCEDVWGVGFGSGLFNVFEVEVGVCGCIYVFVMFFIF